LYGSRAVAEKSPYKLGRHIRPFRRTRGTWSNPRRFRPHPPATGPSRLARPPGRRWAPWSGQVPPARQLAPRSPPRPPAPGVEPAPALGYAVPVPGAPWLRAPPPAVDGRTALRVVQFASNPVPRASARCAGLALPINRRAGARGHRVGGSAGGGPDIYIHTPTLHPPPSRPPTHLPSQDDSPCMAHSRERRQAPWNTTSPGPDCTRHPRRVRVPPASPESEGAGAEAEASTKRQGPRRPMASAKKRPPPALPGGRPVTRPPPRHPTAPTGSAGVRVPGSPGFHAPGSPRSGHCPPGPPWALPESGGRRRPRGGSASGGFKSPPNTVPAPLHGFLDVA